MIEKEFKHPEKGVVRVGLGRDPTDSQWLVVVHGNKGVNSYSEHGDRFSTAEVQFWNHIEALKRGGYEEQ